MSTRATYQIDNTTLYIHHDGYPAGAARKFEQAVKDTIGGKDGKFLLKFMHAHPDAVITKSHAAHGHTAYHYTVTTHSDQNGIHIKAETENGHLMFKGALADFIIMHRS